MNTAPNGKTPAINELKIIKIENTYYIVTTFDDRVKAAYEQYLTRKQDSYTKADQELGEGSDWYGQDVGKAACGTQNSSHSTLVAKKFQTTKTSTRPWFQMAQHCWHACPI